MTKERRRKFNLNVTTYKYEHMLSIYVYIVCIRDYSTVPVDCELILATLE